MGIERGVLVAYGCDRLLCDIMTAALSHYGWRMVSPTTCASESADVVLVLVFNPHTVTAAVEDIQRARLDHPQSKIILLGSGIATADVLRFIEAGVVAYVDSRQGLPELLDVVQMVREKCSPPNSQITSLVVADIIRLEPGSHTRAFERLTVREKQIFDLVNQGLSNKEIADSLSIAPNTVKNHVHNLLEKLKIKSRRETASVRSGTFGHPVALSAERLAGYGR